MLYQIIISPILIIPLLIATKCNQTDKNQTDVIVTYSNHEEAKEIQPKIETLPEAKPETGIQILMPEKYLENSPVSPPRKKSRQSEEMESSNEVVFVPNERAMVQNEEYFSRNPVNSQDYLERKTVGDVIASGPVRVETEAPNDVIFLRGKNDQNENRKETKKQTHDLHGDTRRSESRTAINHSRSVKLDCTNLNCNNTVNSTCGGKLERRTWRYRLFLNDCFFRKVNCCFRNEINRFLKVSMEKCQNVGAHAPKPEFNQMYLYPPMYPYPVHRRELEKSDKVGTRRNIPSRRSMSRRMDGKSCDHPCPVLCPDNYDPECAVSGTGKRKVFENHCKLDFNSCTYRVVWHKRPLSECVGGKKADMQQNRGFIDWMQRVGIVDKKGRLVLS